MWELAKGMGLIYMAVSGGIDIKKRSLAVGWLLLGTVGALCMAAVGIWTEGISPDRDIWQPVLERCIGIAFGVMFFGISHISRQQLGYGDSWILLNLGIAFGIWDYLSILALSFFLTGVGAVLVFVIKRDGKKAVPFLPFVAAGYMGVCLCG